MRKISGLTNKLLPQYNGGTKISCNTARSLQDFFKESVILDGYEVQASAHLYRGSNFYFKLRDLGLHNLLTFDFSAFARSLIGSDTFAAATYYIGAVRTDGTAKTQELFNNQRRLFAHLKKHQVQYSLGYLLKSDGAFHEKGVDVNIAVDLLVAAYEDLGDTLFLVSSDTDLLPAIKKAQDKGKQVVYIGFSHKLSRALVANCQETRTLTRDSLLPFVIPEIRKAA